MLEIKNLTYTVTDEKSGKQVKILDDVSVTINERFVAVTGPNGSGKSTLAKLIAGIYKADSGQIILDGVDITDETREIIFTNLVDTDMLFGHRNNAEGYGKAIEEIDDYLEEILPLI